MAFMMSLALQAQQTLPYEYGFEDNDLAAAGWTMSNCHASTGINTSAKMNGTYGFRFYYTSNYPQYLISPELTGATGGLMVEFYYKNSSSSFAETFKVGYSTTDNDPASFTWGEEITASNTQWTLYSNGSFPAGTKYIAIQHTSDDQFYLYLDDFTFMVPPTCPKPTGLAYSNLTAHTVDLNWTAGGTETEWTIDANGTLTTGVTTNPYTLTGLTAGTEYTVKVKANCTDEDASDWSNTVSFTTLPTCIAPSTLAVTEGSITTTSAEISWTDNNETDPANGWTIDVNGTEVAATTNPFTLTNLTPSSSYTVKVKANCSDEDASAWSSTITFATECATITTLPWLNDFEDFTENTVPVCWDNSASTSTTLTNNPERIWGVYSYNGNKMLRMHNYLVQSGAALINSPAITLPTEDVYALSFKYSHLANCGAFTVKISNDGGNTFVEKGSFTATSTSYNYTNPGTFTNVLPISLAEYAGETIIVQFYANANFGSGAIFIDDVNIDVAPTCFDPSALHLDTVTATTATLSWTDNNETAPEGWTISLVAGENEIVVPTSSNPATVENLDPETTYVVKVKANCDASSESAWSPSINVTTTPSCLAPTNLTYTDLQSTSVTLSWTANNGETQWIVVLNDEEILVEENPVTISTLTAETDYTVKVRSLCSVEDTSHNSNTVAFYTGICVPAPTSVDNNGITNVTFGQTEVVNNTTHPSSSPYYGNYTEQIGDGAAGTVVTVDVTYATGYTYGTVIWVNWNNDVEFTDDEVVFAGTSTSSNPTTLSCTFTIPASTPVGTYRMRIGGADSQFDAAITNGNGYNPCKNTTYTIYEDYTLSVTEAPACVAPAVNPATDVTATSATISWTANSSETEWTIEVNGVETAGITENPYTLEDLTPATAYSVRVKANCSEEDVSDWSTAITFTTECAAVASLEEGFESYTSGLPICWDKVGAGTIAVQTSQPNSGTKSLKFSGVTNGNIVALPVIESYDGMTLTFYTKPESNNSSCGTFAVGYITDISDATTFTAIETYNYNDFSVYTQKEIELSNVPANARLAFNHMANATYYYWFVDDINIGVTPTCLRPSDVTISDITTTSATIAWTDNNTTAPQGWTIELNGTTEVAAATNPYTLEDLTVATIYTVRVKANCTDEDMSDWSNEVTFATECDAVAAAGYVEDFTAYASSEISTEGVLPTCWAAIFAGTDNDYAPHVSHAGYYLEMNDNFFSMLAGSSSAGSANYAIMPELEGLNGTTITFNYLYESTSYGALTFGYVTDIADASTFTAIGTLTASTTVTEAEYELTDIPADARLAFKWEVSGAYSWYSCGIDDIAISGGEPIEEPCETPTNVAVNDNVVTWTGDAASYNVQVSVAGVVVIDTTVSTTTYAIEGLNDGDHASVTVQAVCSEDNLSEWSEAVEFDYILDGVNNYSIKANIYPNPTTGNVTVESNAINADITVFDMFGKLMMTSKVAAERTELNFSSFAPGVYMVRIANSNAITTVKVVKE